jgi:hypothetical protein
MYSMVPPQVAMDSLLSDYYKKVLLVSLILFFFLDVSDYN